MNRAIAATAGVVLVLVFAASAQAAYDDAISINISNTTEGDVSGAIVGAEGFSASNWINTPYNAPGMRSNAGAVLAGSTSTGAALPSNFALSLYCGGWSSLGAWTEASAPDNTIGKTGWNVGNMANTAWGWTRGDVWFFNVPADFAAAGYDIYAYAGHSQTTLSWIKMTDVNPLTDVNPARIYGSQSGLAGTGTVGGGQPCPADNWRIAAYQILKVGATPPALHPGDINGDGTVDLQDFGTLKDNFGVTEGAVWATGDLTADGAVDLQDFGVLKDHFGHTNGDSPVNAVPEPATMSLLALAGLAVLRRKAR